MKGGSNASSVPVSRVSDYSGILLKSRNRFQDWVSKRWLHIAPINKSVVRGRRSDLNLSFPSPGFSSRSKNGLVEPQLETQAQAWERTPENIVGKHCVRFLGSSDRRTILELWRFRQCSGYCQVGKKGGGQIPRFWCPNSYQKELRY